METETTPTETETNVIATVAVVGTLVAGATALYALKRRYDRKKDEKMVAVMMEAFNAQFAADSEQIVPS